NQQDDDDQQDEPGAAARVIAPAAAVGPSRQRADQQQDQNNNQNSAKHRLAPVKSVAAASNKLRQQPVPFYACSVESAQLPGLPSALPVADRSAIDVDEIRPRIIADA